jgi:hypothetical protein
MLENEKGILNVFFCKKYGICSSLGCCWVILCGKWGVFEFGLWVVSVIFARKVVFQIPIYFRRAGETMTESIICCCAGQMSLLGIV